MTPSRFIVVMGVSGSGKTTVARGLAERLGGDLGEGDDLHPPRNVARMAAGVPLTDDDRWPWLDAIGDWMDERAAQGRDGVLTCSALRRVYRDRLRAGRPGVVFCHLVADPDLVRERMEGRTGHYMPASLLRSQLDLLEPLQPDEPGVTVDADAAADSVVEEALRALTPGR